MVKDCKPEMAACEANLDCKAMLSCVSFECSDLRTHADPSDRIKRAEALSAALGESYSPMICDKSCYDDYGYGNDEWISLSACGGRADGIRAPLSESQQCMDQPPVIKPFEMRQLEGEWWKVWNHGWDFWQCHRHTYSPVSGSLWKIDVNFQIHPVHHPAPTKESLNLLVRENTDDEHGNLPSNASFTMLPYFHMGADTYESHYVLAISDQFVIAAACVYTIEMARTDAVVYILAKTPQMQPAVQTEVVQELLKLGLNASTFVHVNNTHCIGV